MKKSTLEGVEYQAVHRLAVGCSFRSCCQVFESNIQLKVIGSWGSNSYLCIVSWLRMPWASTETMENTRESALPHPRAGSALFLENVCPASSQPFQWWRSHTCVQDSLFLDLSNFLTRKIFPAFYLTFVGFSFLFFHVGQGNQSIFFFFAITFLVLKIVIRSPSRFLLPKQPDFLQLSLRDCVPLGILVAFLWGLSTASCFPWTLWLTTIQNIPI